MKFDPNTGKPISDDSPATPAAGVTPDVSAQDDTTPPQGVTPDSKPNGTLETANARILELNEENKNQRLKFNEKLEKLNAKLSEFKSSQKADLESQGEFEKLYQDATSQLKELESLPEQVKSLTEENQKYQEHFSGMLEQKRKLLPESELAIMDKMTQFEQLAHIEKYHAAPAAPKSDDIPAPQGGNLAFDEILEKVKSGKMKVMDIKDEVVQDKVIGELQKGK